MITQKPVGMDVFLVFLFFVLFLGGWGWEYAASF